MASLGQSKDRSEWLDNSENSHDHMWGELQQGIDQLYRNKEMSRTVKRELHSRLISLVYRYCLSVNRHSTAYDGGPKGESEAAKFSFENLVKRVRNHLETYLITLKQDVGDMIDEEVLKFYTKEREDYQNSSKALGSAFLHLNRYLWMRKRDDYLQIKEWDDFLLSDDIYPIYQMALGIWRNHIFQQAKTAVLTLVKRDRNGETINTQHVSCIFYRYVSLSLNEDDPLRKSQILAGYFEDLENNFLKDAKTFHATQLTEIPNDISVTEFMKKVEQRVLEEEKRICDYFPTNTFAKLGQVLYGKHLDIFYNEFDILLNYEKCEDLALTYRLLSRIPNGLEMLRSLLMVHVTTKGKNAIDQCGESIVNDPKLYVKTLMAVHQKYFFLVRTAFKADHSFKMAFDKACFEFINNNKVSKHPNQSSKSSELIAKYCDILLKKSSNNFEGEKLTLFLKVAFIVIWYIEDRDAFEKFYIKMFAKRLFLQMTVGLDFEATMISQLKRKCNPEFILRLQRMLQDVKVSEDLNDKFKTCSSEPLDLDFSIQIITSEAWPCQQSQQPFTLPLELERCVSRFTFFSSQHCHRSLNWLYHLSKGEIVTNCFKRRYTLQVSTFQIAVLLQFNNTDSLLISQLQELTGMSQDILIPVVQILLKCKLLTSDNDMICSDTKVNFFRGYENRKHIVNINIFPPMKIESEQED